MKTISNRMIVALVVCALTGASALAEGKSKDVTFHENVQVNGTLVKKGTYKVSYNEQTSELTITKNKKMVAKTPARLEKHTGNPNATYATKQGTNILSRVILNGGDQAVITESGGSTTAGK